jgi:DUF1707 SHOCT-like domain
MPEPALRASDDDRDTVLRALERHTAVGRLSLDEFDQRSTAALAAVTLDELAALTADLPELPDESARPVEPASHARHLILLFVIAFVTLAALVAMMLLHPLTGPRQAQNPSQMSWPLPGIPVSLNHPLSAAM